MRKSITIKKILNEDYEGANKHSLLARETKGAGDILFKSMFYYKISNDSELFDSNSGYCTISWRHSKPINYKNFHEYIVPLDLALSHLGYNMLEDDSIWREKFNTDDDFADKIIKIINLLKPISKEEYIKHF